MKGLKGLKGFKGVTTLGVLLLAALALVMSAFYFIPVFADADRISSPTVAPSTVLAGQRLPSLNFSVNVGTSGNVSSVIVNFSVFGANTDGNFSIPSSWGVASNNSVTCGGVSTSLPGWRASINGTAVICYNVTELAGAGSTLGLFNISIVNTTAASDYIRAPNVTGTFRFNISTIVNETAANMNSTTVSVTVQKITGRATINVSAAEIGKNQALQFTITIPDDSDRTINKIEINFSAAGFTAPTTVSCPAIGAGWGTASIGANDVICSTSGANTLGAGASKTVILNDTSAGQTPGVQSFSVGLYDTTLGDFANFTNSTTITVYGLLNITGTSMAPATTYINRNGTDNATQAIRLNFSARGEGMNITEINLTRTGTAQNADILEVAIYNTTDNATGGGYSVENATLIAKNSTFPRADGTYTFRNIAWNVSGVTNGWLLVAYNVSRSATGGRTVGFMINSIANVSATGAVSGRSITEVLVTEASNNATIVGNITITGTDVLSGAISAGTANVSVIRLNFTPSGEQMNVTQINLTRTGTATNADILAVGLYNSSSDGLNVYTANATMIAWNSSAPRADGTYNFTGLDFNVTTAGNQLLVVINVSSNAVAGRTVGFKVSPAANTSVTSSVSGQAITPTIVTTSTNNATLGNLTISGTNMAPAATYINRNGTDNATQAIRFNFTARGEDVNITEINLTRTGTAQNADILEVAIYNTTDNATGGAYSVENATLIAKNSTFPRADGTYTFRNIAWNVSNATNGWLLVAFNVSRSATAGRTVGFTITSTANVTSTGAVSGMSVSELMLTEASNNATIVGNLTITGTDILAGAIPMGTANVSVIRLNFTPSGEQMNVTQINLTRTGTATNADILAVGLYNSSSDGLNVYTANATMIAWNSSAPRADGTYNFTGLDFNVTTAGNQLLVVINVSSNAVAGRTVGFKVSPAANTSVTSSVSGQAITPTIVTTSSINATLSNFTIVGTNMMPATVFLNRNDTNNATQAARFNFSAIGEGLNITEINVTRTGTAQNADILEVAIYNTTDNATGGAYSVENATLIAKNSSAPRADGTYTFRNIAWNVSGVTNGWLLVAYNVSRSATGGRTVGFMINSIANVSATGAVSGRSISAVFVTGASNNATIVGNLTITGTSDAPATTVIGTSNVSIIRFAFAPSGEQMNVTQINLTRTGTATNADILAVGLYNSSSDGLNVYTANATMIAWNSSAPRADGTYNFTGLDFNVTTAGNQLLVVVNLSSSATGGRTVGFAIRVAANVTVASAVSNQSITPTLATEASANTTLVGNMTITGTNMMPATVLLNKNSTDNATQAIRLNFSARGEGMNITEINLTRTGTAQNADILEVAIYNATPDVAGGMFSVENATLITKNSSAPRADGTYTFRNIGFNVSTALDNFLIVAFNVSRSATTGRTVGFMITSIANITTTSSVSNQSVVEHLLTAASNNATIVGNLTITGTSASSSIETIGTKNLSIVTFNFAASGEQMNVTQINLTRTGTATNADILAVGLYNSSSDGLNVYTANATMIAWNSSAPRADGTYNFTGLGFNVTTAGNQLLVVVNLSSSATVGSTIGFMLYPAGNVTVASSVSNQSITATLVTTSAGNATLVGNLTITGTNRISSSVAVGTKNVTAVSLNFTVSSEQMNITAINVSRTGSATDADITAVGLFNGTNTTYTGNEEWLTLIAWNTSAPSNGVYNFSGIGFNVSTTPRGNILLVVVNLTNGVTTGRTVGFRLDSAANITTSGSVSNQSITETLITAGSSNSSIYGNLTITGTNQVASTVTVGSRNITFISYNFSAMGEAMNVTEINLTLTGSISTADIESVALYNGTNTTFNIDFLTEIRRNSSAPRADGTYTFRNIGFNVTANDRDGNMLLVVVNFTAGSTTSGGKTVGFMIKAANVSAVSAISNVSITPALATEASNNATVVGNLTVTTTSDISANVKINQKKVAFLNLSFMARGEVVNVTSINVTLRGNASFANVSEIKLYNDDGSATGSMDDTDTVINGTVTAPSSGRITFTPTDVIRLTPSTAKTIFVVLNVSDESDGGAVVGVQINSTDVAAATNVTNMSASMAWTAVASANRTIASNIDPQVLGINAPSWATLEIPSQTILESIGRTAGMTQNFNISKILYSLRTNYRFVYGNTDGTSSGWKLFDRTDWAGSTLQYANYTFNGGYVWVNMTAEDTFEL